MACINNSHCLRVQAAAEAVGKKIAELCKAHGIEKVAFDRGGFTYHGRIKVRFSCAYDDVFPLAPPAQAPG